MSIPPINGPWAEVLRAKDSLRTDLRDALNWLDVWIADGPPTEQERVVVKGFVEGMRSKHGEHELAEPRVITRVMDDGLKTRDGAA